MSAPEPIRAKERFLEALELDEPGRREYLARLEREEPTTFARVRELLAAHSAAGALDRPIVGSVATRARDAGSGAIGTQLGDYLLLEEAGSGAFGVVWRARQVSLDRVVALKVLHLGRRSGSREQEQLRAEAEAVARLDHPHIVPVYEIGEHEGHAFFSMKWIEGPTLAERLDKPWPARAAAALMVDVARAVHHAHQRGLIHRDLKPSNVLLDERGFAYVADFGIAKRLEGPGGATTTNAMAGTPAYMAPEQVEGEELTIATDLWALGCILYELLACRKAFGGATLTETLRRIRRAEPESLRGFRRDVPRDLETIALVCLRREPARRYASAAALADDLERWLAHEPIAARRTGPLERLFLFCRRSPLAAGASAIAATSLVLLAAVSIWAGSNLETRLRESQLGEARATRLAGAVGARDAALDLLARAAKIRPGSDLRDEAIAALAMTDFAAGPTVPRRPEVAETFALHADARTIAVGGARGITVLDALDGRTLVEIPDEEGVSLALWSPRARRLLTKPRTAGPDGWGCKVWDVETGREVARLAIAPAVRELAFLGEGDTVICATAAHELAVVEVATGKPHAIATLGEGARELSLSPSGALVALGFGGKEPHLEVRDAATGELRRAVPLDTVPWSLCWLDEERALAVGTADGRVLVIGAEDGVTRAEGRGHAAEVVAVFASTSLPLIASYSWDETTRVFDAHTGRELRRFSGLVIGFGAEGRSMILAQDRSWRTWNVQSSDVLDLIHAHRGKSPRDVAFSRDGATLLSVGPDGVWSTDLAAAGRPREVAAVYGHTARFLPGDAEFAVSSHEGLWRAKAGEELRAAIREPVLDMALSGDGETLGIVTNRDVRLLDPATFAERRRLSGGESMEFLSISRDATRVAVGNWRGLGVRLWDLRRDETPRVLEARERNVACALSPDGELLATANSERLAVFRTSDLSLVHASERLRSFGYSAAPVAFSPDGASVAFGWTGGLVRIVDTRTFATVATLEPPFLGAVSEFAFSPDSTRLAVACTQNQVQVWDLRALDRELARLGLGGLR